MNFFQAVSAARYVPASPPAEIITSNLWIDLRPEFVSGSLAIDQSGNGRNATLYNGALATTTPTGQTAFYTDGINDAIHYRITSAAQKPSTNFPFTGECWLYRDDSMTIPIVEGIWGKPHNSRFRMFRAILYQGDQVTTANNALNGNFYTNLVTDGDNSFRASGQQVNVTHSQTTNPTTNQTWYHLVCVWYNNAFGQLRTRLLMNGVLVDDGGTTQGSPFYAFNAAWPWEGGVTSSQPMSWGYGYVERATAADLYRQGYAGDFRMYTSALTDAEVLQNFNATKSRYGY
jgi:hypothetical protein